MSRCSHCGDLIIFRNINGRCIPLHKNGFCTVLSKKTHIDFTKEHHTPNFGCYKTLCPICAESVFFVRHNGGSVWFNDPLGPPWSKHSCFLDNPEILQPSTTILISSNIAFNDYQTSQSTPSGVIRYTKVMEDQKNTICILETGIGEAYLLDIKNNANHLLGRLCEINNQQKTIRPFDDLKLNYIIKKIKKTSMKNSTFCHICRSEIHFKNLEKHLLHTHQIP